jgi:hypothetical protein
MKKKEDNNSKANPLLATNTVQNDAKFFGIAGSSKNKKLEAIESSQRTI